jgi:hypothetical protein
MADVPVAGALIAITASCRPILQGLTPPLVGPLHRPGESLLCAGARLVLLLCRDVDFLLVDWCRALSPSHTMAIELQEQLLAQERELDSREGAIIMWEEGLAAFAHVLREVRVERDASRARADAI